MQYRNIKHFFLPYFDDKYVLYYISCVWLTRFFYQGEKMPIKVFQNINFFFQKIFKVVFNQWSIGNWLNSTLVYNYIVRIPYTFIIKKIHDRFILNDYLMKIDNKTLKSTKKKKRTINIKDMSNVNILYANVCVINRFCRWKLTAFYWWKLKFIFQNYFATYNPLSVSICVFSIICIYIVNKYNVNN